MASKIHGDNTVNGRRLRPVYEWLDNGNNKKALQEAEKVLRKQPGNQCARVLKALALLRLGKEDECQTIIDKVRSEVPCEEVTLQAMSVCYKEINQPNKISEVYEAAAKADPNNEDHLTQLFMSYVRLEDYKKQQQTALALYKLRPKNPYYFWAVMSIVMQAVNADEKLAKGITLPLAERMVLKLVKEDKIEAEQEVKLYLMILDLQGKYEQMLEVLESPLATHLSSVSQRKAALLLKLGRFEDAANAYKNIVRGSLDDWASYMDYFTAALSFQDSADCSNFLNELISTSTKNIRSLHLAQLELLKRSCDKNDAQSTTKIINLMYEYFLKFGEKGCIVSDLRLYLPLLNQDGKTQLLEQIDKEIGIESDGYPTSVGQMQKHIHLEKLRRVCGFHHSPLADKSKQYQVIERLWDLYKKGNELCPFQDRLPTDFCPADAYVIIAVHLLHQLWVETEEAVNIYRAVALLERALLTSPANFHLKILLVRMYLELGLIGAANRAFIQLDIKHIQLDSLGHLHTPMLAPFGHLSVASEILDHTAKFFITSYKDSADHLTLAYKFGSFIKIQEFVELRERLENSLNFAMTTVDKMILEITWCETTVSVFGTLASMHIQPHVDSIRWTKLRDNRDLDVVVGWEPTDGTEKDPRMQEETRSCIMRLLSGRSLILRIVATTAEIDSTELLVKLSTELKDLHCDHIIPILQKFEDDNRKEKPCNILVPMDAVERLREAYYSEQFITIAQFTECVAQCSSPNPEIIAMLARSKCVKPLPVPEQGKPISYKKFLLRAATCSETLALLTIITTAYIAKFEPTSTTGHKKNKKKSTLEIESKDIGDDQQSWHQLTDFLIEKLQDIDDLTTEFMKHQICTGLENEEESTSILLHAHESLAHSCRSIRCRAQVSLKLLQSLKS